MASSLQGFRRARTAFAVVLGLTMAAAAGLTGPEPAVAAATSSTHVDRLAGADRYATGVAVSQAAYPSSTPGSLTVFIASGEDFPDALSVAWATRALQSSGPLLLTGRNSLPAVVRAELTRLQPGTIYVVGGPSVVSDAVLAALGQYTTGTVDRLSGPDRYATSAAVSDAFARVGQPVTYVATGENYPDALAASPVAIAHGGNLLLTTPTAIPPAVAAELTRIKPGRIVVVGSAGVVSDAVETALQAYTTGTVTRVSGPDRYQTAAALNQDLGQYYPTLAVATGENFPDALSATTLGVPILLTPTVALGDSARNILLSDVPDLVDLIGSDAVVSAAVESSVQAMYSDVSSPVTGLGVARRGATTVGLAWTNPSDPTYGGALVVGKPGTAAPVTPTDGTFVTNTFHNPLLTSVTDVSLSPGTTYSYSVFATNLMGITYSAPVSVTVTTGEPAPLSHISVGEDSACAVTASGGTWCWGPALSGVLGSGTREDEPSPGPVQGESAGMTSVDVGLDNTVGGPGACSVDQVGGVSCWGPTYGYSPVAIAGLPAVTFASAGGDHTCAVSTTHELYCWGQNANGELGSTTGNGTQTSFPTPQVVAAVGTVEEVSTGSGATCAVTTAGAAYCWGDNVNGQLGTTPSGSRVNPTPTQVTGLGSGVAHISMGYEDACAAMTNGQVRCWGSNSAGQLGDGTRTSSPTPVTVAGLPAAAVSVSAGVTDTCAVLSDSSVWCWGSNGYGLLGGPYGSPGSPTPVKIAAPHGATSVDVGYVMACIIDTQDHGACWGTWVGDGTTQTRRVPTLIDLPASS